MNFNDCAEKKNIITKGDETAPTIIATSLIILINTAGIVLAIIETFIFNFFTFNFHFKSMSYKKF